MYGGFGGFNDMMGGFFPSPQKQGAPSASRPPPAEIASRDVQGLVPVTVKMVLEAATSSQGDGASDHINSVMRFHGNHEASQVEIIGQVDSAELLGDQMFAKYFVDDGTGRIVCKKFIEPEKNFSHRGSSPEVVAVGKFVRVIGPFRRFGSESYINANRLEEVRVLDDITRHRIEVIHAMLQLNGQLNESTTHSSSGFASIQSTSITSASDLVATRPQENADPNVGSVGSTSWFLRELHRAFGPRGNKYNSSHGVSRQQLYIHFVSTMTSKQVDDKIKLLHEEGHLFSTSDDNHFQLTG